MKTRAGRAAGRPLDTRNTMHLILKSTKAKGELSFLHSKNSGRIKQIVKKFSVKYGVKILSMGNVGNHLHLHIKLSNRFGYAPFIRAVTSAIAMAVTGRSRWSKGKISAKGSSSKSNSAKEKFWDLRPFTRVIIGLRAFFTLRDYVKINQLEGQGVKREVARMMIKDFNASG